jgi:hypothetical protein
MKRIIIITFIFLLSISVFSVENNQKKISGSSQSLAKYSTALNDSPSPVMLSWIGVGNLARYTVSNTGQNGYFEPPPGWENYNGQFPFGFTSGNGRTGEFPRGSKQYYVWAAGLWVGAKVREIVGTDTMYDKRVATGAYYSDQGALSDLYQSNQVIPDGFEGAGDFYFKQKEADQKADYQILWNFADSSINQKRLLLGYDNLLINPEAGDYISNEDTYCVWGDYLPEEDAVTLFLDAYDTKPVGIRVEQRSYSWSTDDFIYLNYRITNMNDFPLRDVYFGYFMDNDIGDATDDLIGYDENLNLGYSYDSDLQESGWQTLAGYMGTVFVETPRDSNGVELGLTGFQTWVNGSTEGDVDNDASDNLKYDQLQKVGFEIFSVPQDVRQLTSCGPLRTMQPGETVEVTIAVVPGGSLDELRKNTERAYERYDLAFIGPEPPPSPVMNLNPGDRRVIIGWDNSSESVPDPFSGLLDFEGYRVYRSEDGGITWGTKAEDRARYPNGYIPLAEFDLAGNQSDRFVSVSYISGNSTASITFEGFIPGQETLFNESQYSIEILPGNQLFVYNLTQLKSYLYNISAQNEGVGFSIIDRNSHIVYDDPTYISNALIAFDGIYVSIKNDTTYDNGLMEISIPEVGDVFRIQTFERREIGDQLGLGYYFDDSGLTNGFSYVYSVTAFDAGDPKIGLPPLESSLFANKQNIVPRAAAADRTVDAISNVQRIAGESDGFVNVSKGNPFDIVSAQFEIQFLNTLPNQHFADYVRIYNTTADTVVIDSLLLVEIVAGDQTRQKYAAYSFHGLNFLAIAPSVLRIDTEQFKWKQGGFSSYMFNIVANISRTTGPYDFEIEFTDFLNSDSYSGDTVAVPEGGIAPWTVRNITKGIQHKSYALNPFLSPGEKIIHNSIIYVLNENPVNNNDVAFSLILNTQNPVDPVRPGDTWQVKTKKPFFNGEKYLFSSTALNEKISTDSYTLDKVKVVPNPYYIRAQWDTDRFNKHINFTHLPEKCRIRIFTTSGILIRTIEHDEQKGDPAGYHRWTLRNKENLDIASGLYIYQVEDLKSGKIKTGKFAVVL